MNIVKYLLALLFVSNLHASFYKEMVIHPSSPLSVLDPARRPKIERLVTNLRLFGNLGPRPSKDVFIHHQSMQNLVVFPTDHLTALAWMLFPISQIPTINPNNVRDSDPLGKLTPETLGKLIGVMARFANPYYQGYYADDLLDMFKIFDPERAEKLLKNYSPDNNPELQEFYRYSLLEALSNHISINCSIADLDNEDSGVSEAEKAYIKANPHHLAAFVLSQSSSHLLEIPGTEILRSADETWFTKAELDAELQELPQDVERRTKYKALGYKAREEHQIHAAVDMLYKSAKKSPNEVLELLAYYAWRKFPEQMHDVIWASGSVNQAQYAKVIEVLSNPYSKADYESLVAEFKAAENADDFFESLTPAQQNLLLYGDASYNSMIVQEYGNVRVNHGGKSLGFANCAEMSLFNLTYLALLTPDGIGLSRSVTSIPDSPLKTFWQNLKDEDLSTTATRNAWTQMMISRQAVVYRKGGSARQPWNDESSVHWAELNPGILNQMRALFHLLAQENEALQLDYTGSTEETVTAAALKLSRLLSGGDVNDASADDSLPFIIAIGKLENKPAAKDWFGELTVEHNGSQIATWYIQTNHSYVNLSNRNQVFDPAIKTSNPLIMGQMVIAQPDYSQTNSHEAMTRLQQTYWAMLDGLNASALADFFRHANLVNERLRNDLGIWLCGDSKQDDNDFHFSDGSFVRVINRKANAKNPLLAPYATRLFWGMCPVDDGRELHHIINGSSLRILKQPEMLRLISFSSTILGRDFFDKYSQSCMAYRMGIQLSEINPEFFVPANRVSSMNLHLWGGAENPPAHNIGVGEALRIFEASVGKFERLQDLYPHFSNCSSADVAKIMAFMPQTPLSITLFSSVSPEQLFALVNGRPSYKVRIFNFSQWCRIAPLPATLEEFGFNLLEPLARSGKPFEPPFIDFGEEADLEPVYARLRKIAPTPSAGTNDDELRNET